MSTPQCACEACRDLFQHPLVEAATPALKEELAAAITIYNSHARCMRVAMTLMTIGLPASQIMPIGEWIGLHIFQYPSPGSLSMLKTIPCEAEADIRSTLLSDYSRSPAPNSSDGLYEHTQTGQAGRHGSATYRLCPSPESRPQPLAHQVAPCLAPPLSRRVYPSNLVCCIDRRSSRF
ncbi:hypothetical protein C8J57DRAFT_1491439 [Mycena rebaudengoi]|nr:hypothetical protein C8J57DRAFT_1491439 [Mycena rebaudengoi]